MEPAAQMEALLELAQEAGIPVRVVGGGEGDGATTSASVRVRGQLWVVLSRSDPVDAQLAVLASALRTHAAGLLESRYLPPALRALLDPAGD